MNSPYLPTSFSVHWLLAIGNILNVKHWILQHFPSVISGHKLHQWYSLTSFLATGIPRDFCQFCQLLSADKSFKLVAYNQSFESTVNSHIKVISCIESQIELPKTYRIIWQVPDSPVYVTRVNCFQTFQFLKLTQGIQRISEIPRPSKIGRWPKNCSYSNHLYIVINE